jgi:hypothetical protein
MLCPHVFGACRATWLRARQALCAEKFLPNPSSSPAWCPGGRPAALGPISSTPAYKAHRATWRHRLGSGQSVAVSDTAKPLPSTVTTFHLTSSTWCPLVSFFSTVSRSVMTTSAKSSVVETVSRQIASGCARRSQSIVVALDEAISSLTAYRIFRNGQKHVPYSRNGAPPPE